MTLDEVDALLKKAHDPKDVFGTEPERTHRKLLATCHPDRNVGDKRAEELFNEIQRLYELLQHPPKPVKSPKRLYTLHKIIAVGDIADLHLATGDGHSYILKISRIVGGDKLLNTEAKVIKELLTKAGTTHYARYFPTIAETFLAKDKIQKRINVFVADEGYFTLEEIHQRHLALDGRHLAWIFKRLLTAIGFTARAGYIHGAVFPSHVRLSVDDHGLQLVGWGHSVSKKDIIRTISTKYRNWYPKEVLEKKPATPATDISMAGKCMVYLAGGDPIKGTMPKTVPSSIQRFIKSCILEGQSMRPQDAWSLLDEFDELLKKLYGPPKFHKLVMS